MKPIFVPRSQSPAANNRSFVRQPVERFDSTMNHPLWHGTTLKEPQTHCHCTCRCCHPVYAKSRPNLIIEINYLPRGQKAKYVSVPGQQLFMQIFSSSDSVPPAGNLNPLPGIIGRRARRSAIISHFTFFQASSNDLQTVPSFFDCIFFLSFS